MNWLLGKSSAEVPETPIHRWAFGALKNTIMPDTPLEDSQNFDSKSQPFNANYGNSILKTPGMAKDRKSYSVTFHKSVQTPPKKTTHSGLPRDFSGKFPSPWTPAHHELCEIDAEDMEEVAADSPNLEKFRRDRIGSAVRNPLKRLSMQLQEQGDKDDTVAENGAHTTTTALPRLRKSAQTQSLVWDINKGIEEVLDSVSKNNAYLQELVREMQESCANIDESFTADGPTNASDMTINLDEPRSRSGQYWKSKFSDFSALAAKVKSEQDNMEATLNILKAKVVARNEQDGDRWKDKYELLKEEYQREAKQRAPNHAIQTRQLKDLRNEVKQLQLVKLERDDLKQQLSIADRQIEDLQSQNLHVAQHAKVASATVLSTDAPVKGYCPTSTNNASSGQKNTDLDHAEPATTNQSTARPYVGRYLSKQQTNLTTSRTMRDGSEPKPSNTETNLNGEVLPRGKYPSREPLVKRNTDDHVDRHVSQSTRDASLETRSTQQRPITTCLGKSSTATAYQGHESPRPTFASIDVNRHVPRCETDKVKPDVLSLVAGADKRLEMRKASRRSKLQQTSGIA